MIGFVNGEIEEISDDRVLVDCGFIYSKVKILRPGFKELGDINCLLMLSKEELMVWG